MVSQITGKIKTMIIMTRLEKQRAIAEGIVHQFEEQSPCFIEVEEIKFSLEAVLSSSGTSMAFSGFEGALAELFSSMLIKLCCACLADNDKFFVFFERGVVFVAADQPSK